MKMMNANLLKACQNKWRNASCSSKSVLIPSSNAVSAAASCCRWYLLPNEHDKHSIPKDVPKGHIVVYVGEHYKRYIVKISILKHPLFKALLDLAQDAYDFATGSKLCIPCDEYVFLEVLRCATHTDHDERRCSFSL